MFDYDYITSKIKAIHSKSYFGENLDFLSKMISIDEIFKFIFNDSLKNTKSGNIFTLTEKMFKIKIYNEINEIAKYFDYKNKVINNFILKYEIENVKLIINYYYHGKKEIRDLFEIKLENTIDYPLTYSLDISNTENIKRIFNETYFSFIVDFIDQKKELFFIENSLDKFYFLNYFDSLNTLNREAKEKLSNVFIEEANWHNILWAFRTKKYYKMPFNQIENTFIDIENLISRKDIEEIFKPQITPAETKKITDKYPTIYRKTISEAFNEEDKDIDIPKLEKLAYKRIDDKYKKYFYADQKILTVIAFVHLKMKEYYEVVQIIENLRYNEQSS